MAAQYQSHLRTDRDKQIDRQASGKGTFTLRYAGKAALGAHPGNLGKVCPYTPVLVLVAGAVACEPGEQCAGGTVQG